MADGENEQPLKLTGMKVRDIGPFVEADIEFGPGKDPTKADVHLFVGANGSGKSTLLAAMAYVFSLGGDGLLDRRFRSQNACAVLWTESEWLGGGPTRNSQQQAQSLSGMPVGLTHGHFSSGPGETSVYFLAIQLANAAPIDPIGSRHAREGVFSYSGYRQLANANLNAIQVLPREPFNRSLYFGMASDPQRLIQWIANVETRAALSMRDGAQEDARKEEYALRKLEQAIYEISGRVITFSLARNPLAAVAKLDGASIDFSALPDGLKSIVSWLADLLIRLDQVPWSTPRPVNEQPFILLLDEIEVHLHPAWQRKLLPAIEKLFPNAQIFASTHSPFVVASADDAYIYPLHLDDKGISHVGTRLESRVGESYSAVLREVFGIDSEFDVESEAQLTEFRRLRDLRLRGDASVNPALQSVREWLANRSVELRDIVELEMRRLNRMLGATAA